MVELNTLNSFDTGIFHTLWIISNILWLWIYLLTSWWLYMINSKLWEKYAWLSWIPLLQIYSYFTASKKSVFYYFWLPIILWFLSLFLFLFTYWISILIYYVYLILIIIRFFHSISLRTGNWGWTTVWLVFVPFIMFPVIWYKFNPAIKSKNENVEVISEEKIEL